MVPTGPQCGRNSCVSWTPRELMAFDMPAIIDVDTWVLNGLVFAPIKPVLGDIRVTTGRSGPRIT